MWQWLDTAGTVLFGLSAVGVGVFVILYATRSDWRATEAGRVTLGFMAVVAAIMVSAIVFGTIWRNGHEHERLIVRAALYAALLAMLVRYILVLVRAQRADRAAREP